MGKFLSARRSGRNSRRGRPAIQWSRLELLEVRLLPATIIVNTTADDTTPDGTLSLREAIEVVDGTLAFSALSPREQAQVSGNLSDPNTIGFNIPATGFPIIAPTSALPEITKPVTIDGTSQPGSVLVALDGSGAGASVDGLTISAGNSAVAGLIIGLFRGSGIRLTGRGGNLVRGCFLGTTPQKQSGLGNAVNGVTIDGSPGNLIVSNLLTGNRQVGVSITGTGASGNLVRGNTIGADQPTNQPGILPLGNDLSGVFINNAPGNTIGGTDPGARNIISGTQNFGIAIGGTKATGNLVQGNFIGTDAAGQQSVGNSGSGILIFQGASNNLIGGATTAARNLISGNHAKGVVITDSATSNQVQGNYIGTSVDGKGAMMGLISNFMDGVTIDGASGNTIGGPEPGMGNLISGNGMNGVNIFSTTDGTDTIGNRVQGNVIGTDASGTSGLPNLESGVLIATARGNLIGGTAPGAGNLISANGQSGIEVGVAATGNLIQGNKIGTDTTGTKGLVNTNDGVFINNAPGNTIGGTTPMAGNLISNNHLSGIHVLGDPASSGSAANNLIQGNLIGTDLTGTKFLPNSGHGVFLESASGDTIGGTTPTARNIISGNLGDGVMILEGTANLVQGNYIGLDRSGARNLNNTGNGVTVQLSTDNTIGGTAVGAGNVIGRNEKDGIAITFQSTGTRVQGNIIGLDYTGTQPASNLGNGVSVDNSTGTTIGGVTTAARNIISGNLGDGIKITDSADGVLVQGNLIGTDASGTVRLANLGNGVEVTLQVQNALIGGTTPDARNIISGNQGNGVAISGGGASGNMVEGNFIGTDVTGTKALGNSLYGVIISQSQANLIGGMTSSTFNVVSDGQNVISGNHLAGVFILGKSSTGNVVAGNLIGTDVSGSQAIANDQGGISIGSTATGNTIGGPTFPARNVISGNLTDGVTIAGQGTSGNTVEGNFIGTDRQGTLPLGNGDDGILLDTVTNELIGGTSPVDRNLIAGNSQAGIEIRGGGSSSNQIEGNYIGTTLSGAAPLGNLVGVFINGAPGNTIGGMSPGAGNLISGNSRIDSSRNGIGIGIQILGLGASDNQVVGNFIGIDATGANPLGNDTGIFITGAPRNTIGGPTANPGMAPANVISGNGTIGVHVSGSDASGNQILGNFIGVTASGKQTVLRGPTGLGILINSTNGTNDIGGTLGTSGNVISGFQVGVEIYAPQSLPNPHPGSFIQGNFIGTDKTGEHVLGNTVGVFINGVPMNTIGGPTAADRNIISGNDTGIYLLGSTASNNLIEGNFIGLDKTGKIPLGNHVGIYLDAATGNTIGGPTAAYRNVIAGNRVSGQEGSTGIYFFDGAKGNVVENNFIGTDLNGKGGKGLGQGNYGVLEYNAPNNNIFKSGKGANKIVGSGIAPTREFTGPKPKTPTSGNGSGTGSSVGAKRGPRHHSFAGSQTVPHGPRGAGHQPGRLR